jgi:B-Raf proto-oncogene serine/threonine-protein kinase
LKTNNVFLTEDKTVKIGDFGLATVKTRWSSTTGGQQAMQPTGSILWMAPEVIRMHEHTNRSDVYSFGICLYELLTGRLPYDHINNRDQIIFMVGMGLLKPIVSHLRLDTPSKLRSLFLQCIEYNAENRLEFDEIKPVLHKVAQSLPKLTRSQSDSCLQQERKRNECLFGFKCLHSSFHA